VTSWFLLPRKLFSVAFGVAWPLPFYQSLFPDPAHVLWNRGNCFERWCLFFCTRLILLLIARNSEVALAVSFSISVCLKDWFSSVGSYNWFYWISGPDGHRTFGRCLLWIFFQFGILQRRNRSPTIRVLFEFSLSSSSFHYYQNSLLLIFSRPARVPRQMVAR